MKKLILALMSILLIWSCVREHYDDEQYISGTFEIDGPKWRGEDLDVSNGFFKLWVNKVDHRYRDSKLKQLYNISFFAE